MTAIRLSLICIALLCLSLIVSVRACERPLLVQVVHEPPTMVIEQGKPIAGLDYELVQAIFAEAGCPMRWLPTDMSGARRLRSIERGEFDVLLNVTDLPERQRYAHISRPYRMEVIGVFARAGSTLPPLRTLGDIYANNLPLIAPLQGYYGAEYEDLRAPWLARQQLTTYKDLAVGAQLLFAGRKRADLLLMDADIFLHLAQQHRQPVIWAMAPTHIVPIHLMLSRKSVTPEAAARLDAAIVRLQSSARLARLEARHRAPEILRLLGAAAD